MSREFAIKDKKSAAIKLGVLVLAFTSLDIITTMIGISLGFREVNPFLQGLFHPSGWAWPVLKLCVFGGIAALLIYAAKARPGSWFNRNLKYFLYAGATATIVYIPVITNNILQLWWFA